MSANWTSDGFWRHDDSNVTLEHDNNKEIPHNSRVVYYRDGEPVEGVAGMWVECLECQEDLAGVYND